jgi:uncharacterized metal-binding protein
MESKAHCAKCRIPAKEKICRVETGGRAPDFCPTVHYADLAKETTATYHRPEIAEFARLASVQEAECYADRAPGPYVIHPVKTRIEETVEFAGKLGCRKLGLAFCGGLQKEAGLVADILEASGFVLASVACTCGGVGKESIGIQDSEKVHIGSFESMCNPLLQAAVLNREQTEFNVVLGLCVGHDSLFLKHADAFSTVLAAKDRVTGHNPLGPVYMLHSYYQRMKITKGRS